eukprot:3408278-Pyramimonas_sp.AAC.1
MAKRIRQRYMLELPDTGEFVGHWLKRKATGRRDVVRTTNSEGKNRVPGRVSQVSGSCIVCRLLPPLTCDPLPETFSSFPRIC